MAKQRKRRKMVANKQWLFSVRRMVIGPAQPPDPGVGATSTGPVSLVGGAVYAGGALAGVNVSAGYDVWFAVRATVANPGSMLIGFDIQQVGTGTFQRPGADGALDLVFCSPPGTPLRPLNPLTMQLLELSVGKFGVGPYLNLPGTAQAFSWDSTNYFDQFLDTPGALPADVFADTVTFHRFRAKVRSAGTTFEYVPISGPSIGVSLAGNVAGLPIAADVAVLFAGGGTLPLGPQDPGNYLTVGSGNFELQYLYMVAV